MDPFPTPFRYGVRRDKSIWISFGNPEKGEHHQFDFYAPERIARLTVAAPALLDALIEVMEWIGAWNPNFDHDDEWPASRDKARAAIAAATGETK